MAAGVAEYEENGQPSRILIVNETIQRMNPSYAGKPVYALHQETDLETLHEDSDGYVFESFYNKWDGCHWAKFVVSTDAGHDAIDRGWKLSNSYVVTNAAGGGSWHNVQYDEEVRDGVFEHLALVPNPRYEESIVLTPEEFRAYNERKERELKTLQNSKSKREQKDMLRFKLFQKKKVANANQLADAVIELDDGSTVPFSRVLRTVANAESRGKRNRRNDRDDRRDDRRSRDDDRRSRRRNADGDGEAAALDLDQEITVGRSVMSIRDLIEKYLELTDRENDSDRDNADRDDRDDRDDRRERKENSRRARNSRDDDDRGDVDVEDDDEDLDPEDDDEDERSRSGGGDDRRTNSRDDDQDLDEDGDPVDDEDGRRQADDLRGEDDEPAPRRNARDRGSRRDDRRSRKQNDRKPGKRRNDGDRDGAVIRVSKHELQMLKDSRKIHAESLRNARDENRGTDSDGEPTLDTGITQLQRGQNRYGSAGSKPEDRH